MASKKKVLLADDSSTALMMEEMILKKRTAYDVITARDGREAVEKTLSESPDLVLMDVVMPRLNGFEACRKIRSNASTKDIPVILVTTRGEPQCVEAGFQSGCNDYITKPVNAQEFVMIVRGYLEKP